MILNNHFGLIYNHILYVTCCIFQKYIFKLNFRFSTRSISQCIARYTWAFSSSISVSFLTDSFVGNTQMGLYAALTSQKKIKSMNGQSDIFIIPVKTYVKVFPVSLINKYLSHQKEQYWGQWKHQCSRVDLPKLKRSSTRTLLSYVTAQWTFHK